MREKGPSLEVGKIESEKDLEIFFKKFADYYSLPIFNPEFSKSVASEGNVRRIKTDVESGRIKCFGIKEGDRIVSTAMLSDISQPSTGDTVEKVGHLGFLTVDEDKRQKGLGKKTVGHVLESARQEKFDRVEADVYTFNPHAQDSLGTLLSSGFGIEEIDAGELEGGVFDAQFKVARDVKTEAEEIVEHDYIKISFTDIAEIQKKIGEGWKGVRVLKNKDGESFIKFAKAK